MGRALVACRWRQYLSMCKHFFFSSPLLPLQISRLTVSVRQKIKNHPLLASGITLCDYPSPLGFRQRSLSKMANLQKHYIKLALLICSRPPRNETKRKTKHERNTRGGGGRPSPTFQRTEREPHYTGERGSAWHIPARETLTLSTDKRLSWLGSRTTKLHDC